MLSPMRSVASDHWKARAARVRVRARFSEVRRPSRPSRGSRLAEPCGRSARSQHCRTPTYGGRARSFERHSHAARLGRLVGDVATASKILPSSGCSTPATRRRSTVLPDPDGPKIATISPLSAAREMRSSTLPVLNSLLTERISRLAMISPSPRRARGLQRDSVGRKARVQASGLRKARSPLRSVHIECRRRSQRRARRP